MIGKPKAVLMGPFVGELYWECARFAPMLPFMRSTKYKNKEITYVILTREERFDLYGRYANILLPLRIPGDYDDKMPNCFGLNNYSSEEYDNLAKDYYNKYSDRFEIVEHIYPQIKKKTFLNKNQFPRERMLFSFKPRLKNEELINEYLPKDDKKLIVLAPRYRKGFKRNWPYWNNFYDLIFQNNNLLDKYNFILCGKQDEYIPDEKNRFLDMTKIQLQEGSSLVGLLLNIINRSYFVFGSQSSIPNIALLYKKEVLEFGCQKTLHSVTYNIFKSKITFIENHNYDIKPEVVLKQLIELLNKKEKNNG